MASQSPLPSIIGCSIVVGSLNRRYGLNLSLNGLVLLYMVRLYNNEDIVCGNKHVLTFFGSNSRGCSANQMQDRVTYLLTVGLLTRVKTKGFGKLLNLRVTADGLILLADFERLLLSYKVKGLAK